jgi:hypothetical protein
MYQLYQGTDVVAYDRCDDIWSGLILKRICDHFGWAVLVNGKATCLHDRQSNIHASLFKEQAGHVYNEELWDRLLRIDLTGAVNVKQSYRYIASLKVLPNPQGEYMLKWLEGLR